MNEGDSLTPLDSLADIKNGTASTILFDGIVYRKIAIVKKKMAKFATELGHETVALALMS